MQVKTHTCKSLTCKGVKLMQMRWQLPLRLKQTQVSPLPIHAGELPHAAWSVYNQSGEFLIQLPFSFSWQQSQVHSVERKELKISSFFYLQQVEVEMLNAVNAIIYKLQLWAAETLRFGCNRHGQTEQVTEPYRLGGDIIKRGLRRSRGGGSVVIGTVCIVFFCPDKQQKAKWHRQAMSCDAGAMGTTYDHVGRWTFINYTIIYIYILYI